MIEYRIISPGFKRFPRNDGTKPPKPAVTLPRHCPTLPDPETMVPSLRNPLSPCPDTARPSPTLPDTARPSPTQYDTARHCPTQSDTARHCPTQPDTARHCPTQSEPVGTTTSEGAKGDGADTDDVSVTRVGDVAGFMTWEGDDDVLTTHELILPGLLMKATPTKVKRNCTEPECRKRYCVVRTHLPSDRIVEEK